MSEQAAKKIVDVLEGYRYIGADRPYVLGFIEEVLGEVFAAGEKAERDRVVRYLDSLPPTEHPPLYRLRGNIERGNV